ncbi:tmv resistance protein n [Phtheirospermum japonicum]|uniref:Tmv resistance protein n n=1 Tax=Phtheirospermum japonicum TaxID=374723 RepID=A0A830CDD5_9LAMI|nr:tmv resistance protein n [Phtheirospermum japonicum]
MQRPTPAKITNIPRQIFRYGPKTLTPPRPYDVFISHRSIDTKRNITGLLYHHLNRHRIQPFLDCESMKPGDKIFDKIGAAIQECKVGVAVFSPTYCDSYFCLHELSLMMEAGKKVVPIFCDVKPSELRVKDNGSGSCSAENLDKFRSALEEAKYTVGLSFDTLRGDWPKFLASAADAVIKNLIEVEEERLIREHHK